MEGSNKYIPPYELEKMSYQDGWKEGKAEGIEEIAKQMLSNMDLDIKTVSQATGLSIEKLKELISTSK